MTQTAGSGLFILDAAAVRRDLADGWTQRQAIHAVRAERGKWKRLVRTRCVA